MHIQENYKSEIKNKSFGIKYSNLIIEWNYEKNGMLTPFMFEPNSGEKIWWKCKKGHEWEAIIANRTRRGDSCPYCG